MNLALIEERRQNCLEKGGKSLDLSNCQIETIPEWVWEMKDLERLNLSRNCLGNLDERINGFINLNLLDLSRNPLKTVPVYLKKLLKVYRAFKYSCWS